MKALLIVLLSVILGMLVSCGVRSVYERNEKMKYLEREKEESRALTELKHMAKEKKISVYYGNRGFSYYQPIVGNKLVFGKIELNVDNKNPVFALAHELGHAMSPRDPEYNTLLSKVKLLDNNTEFFNQYKSLSPQAKFVMIEEEIKATKIGYKLLEEIGYKYKDAYGVFYLKRIGSLMYSFGIP